jgi:hypothetical protein
MSTYFDRFHLRIEVCNNADSALAQALPKTRLDTALKQDLRELRKFLIAHETPVETGDQVCIRKYLPATQQPSGELTY